MAVLLSGKLSGTLNSAQQGATLIDSAPPIEFVDSATASIAVGWAAEAALDAVRSGADAAEAAQAARDLAVRTRTVLFVETIDYLLRGGRIGRARHLAGKMLRMRPLLEIVEGEVENIERPRTRRKALDRLFAQIMTDGPPERVAILHGNAAEDANALAHQVSSACGGMDVPVILSAPVLGDHTGPGTVGAALLRRA